MAGIAFMLDIVKEIFEEEGVSGIKVAVMGGDVDNDLLAVKAE